MKIFVGQIKAIAGDVRGNLTRIENAYKKATEAACDICLLPELATSGYLAEDLFFSPDFIAEIIHINNKLVRDSTNCALILPTIIKDKENLYNGVIVTQNGIIIGQTQKAILPNNGVFDEKRYFTLGIPQIVNINGRKFGIPICEDIWHKEVCADLKLQGAEIFLVPNASPFEINKLSKRIEQVSKRYEETNIPFVFCNQSHSQDGIIFDGNSFCYDGTLSIICKKFCEDSAVVLIKKVPASVIPAKAGIQKKPEAISFLCSDILGSRLRGNDLKGSSNDTRQGGDNAQTNHDSSFEENIYEAMKFGLKSYIEDNGFEKVILGLSGGIDSGLVACICVDSIGAKNVSAYMLPSKFTTKSSINDAKELAKLLNIKLTEIPITKILQTYISELGYLANERLEDLTYQNLQARIRGTILMAESNKSRCLLITTGNKSEYATGYATIYGDMNGAFNPIKDIYKTQIFELAKYRNTLSQVIPEDIINKPPSAELATNQKDSDSLPDYALLDKILYSYIELNLPKEELYKLFEPTMVNSIIKLVQNSEFKRKQSAPGVKISTRNFEKDRRFPITNLFFK